jgi:hypothetical protein
MPIPSRNGSAMGGGLVWRGDAPGFCALRRLALNTALAASGNKRASPALPAFVVHQQL